MQRVERIVLSTDVHWVQQVAEIKSIKELYAEFVHIDVAVLQVIPLPLTSCLSDHSCCSLLLASRLLKRSVVQHCCTIRFQPVAFPNCFRVAEYHLMFAGVCSSQSSPFALR